jgi:nucleoid DNA-binding protein
MPSSSSKGPLKKVEFIDALAEASDVKKKDVTCVLDELAVLIGKQLNTAGEITIPGIVKLKKARRAAKPSRPGRNPGTGEKLTLKAKPAYNTVTASPTTAVKNMV